MKHKEELSQVIKPYNCGFTMPSTQISSENFDVYMMDYYESRVHTWSSKEQSAHLNTHTHTHTHTHLLIPESTS